ncbi:MAG: hypothetical protein ACXVZL_05280 [Gaiellaceae bacterium]
MNEDRRRVFGSSHAIAFLCECRDPECRAAVVLTPGQFDAVVAAADVLLHAGHEAAPSPGPLPSELKSR